METVNQYKSNEYFYPPHTFALDFTIKETCKDVEWMTLFTIQNFVTWGDNRNPKNEGWYEMVSDLFTENNGTKMHPEMLERFINYVARSIPDKKQ